jgi:hypothetical protein
MSHVPSPGPERPQTAPARGPDARAALFAGVLLAGSVSVAIAQVAPGAAGPAAVVVGSDPLARLRTAAPEARFEAGLVTGLKLALPGTTPTARAEAFLSTYPGLFGEVGGALSLVPGVERGRSVRFEQVYAGRPVRGGGVTFAFDAEGRLKGYTDEVRPVTSALEPVIDATAAVDAARRQLGLPSTGTAPVARPVMVVQAGLGTPAFEIDLVFGAPFDVRRVVVESVTGRVIGQEALVRR